MMYYNQTPNPNNQNPPKLIAITKYNILQCDISILNYTTKTAI